MTCDCEKECTTNYYWADQSRNYSYKTIKTVETGSPYGGFGKDGLYHDEKYLDYDEIILS